MNHYSLLRGCSLFPLTPTGYALGTLSRVVTVTSAYQRTALTQLAIGMDPLAQVSQPVRAHLNDFLRELREHGLLNSQAAAISVPARSMSEISTSDIAINQLRARSALELAQSEWIDQRGDGGASTLAARALHPIVLSGRSRVIGVPQLTISISALAPSPPAISVVITTRSTMLGDVSYRSSRLIFHAIRNQSTTLIIQGHYYLFIMARSIQS
jgi:hypothetical protein